MMKTSGLGILGFVFLVLLTLVSGACSSQPSGEGVLPASSDVDRSIKVYESPT